MSLQIPDNMKLQEIEDSDHEFLIELHNDPLVLRNLTDPTPITLESHLSWWHNIQNSSKDKRLLFVVDGKRVGITKFYSIDRHNRNCILGADIHKNYRGNGYAKYMWALMLNKCFIEWNLHRVHLMTASFNKVGQRIYTNLGFKIEGMQYQSLYRDHKFYDAINMYMLKNDWLI